MSFWETALFAYRVSGCSDCIATDFARPANSEFNTMSSIESSAPKKSGEAALGAVSRACLTACKD